MRHPDIFRLPVVATLVMVLMLAAGGPARAQAPARLKIGTPAPAFSVKDFSGRKLEMAALRGKVVLVDFWATWCGPCKEEIPHFIEMQKQYGDRGLVVIGISMDDGPKPVRAYAEKFPFNYPIAMGDTKLADRFGGIEALPVAFLIDRDGRIAHRHDGQTDAAVFEKEILELLGK